MTKWTTPVQEFFFIERDEAYAALHRNAQGRKMIQPYVQTEQAVFKKMFPPRQTLFPGEGPLSEAQIAAIAEYEAKLFKRMYDKFRWRHHNRRSGQANFCNILAFLATDKIGRASARDEVAARLWPQKLTSQIAVASSMVNPPHFLALRKRVLATMVDALTPSENKELDDAHADHIKEHKDKIRILKAMKKDSELTITAEQQQSFRDDLEGILRPVLTSLSAVTQWAFTLYMGGKDINGKVQTASMHQGTTHRGENFPDVVANFKRDFVGPWTEFVNKYAEDLKALASDPDPTLVPQPTMLHGEGKFPSVPAPNMPQVSPSVNGAPGAMPSQPFNGTSYHQTDTANQVQYQNQYLPEENQPISSAFESPAPNYAQHDQYQNSNAVPYGSQTNGHVVQPPIVQPPLFTPDDQIEEDYDFGDLDSLDDEVNALGGQLEGSGGGLDEFDDEFDWGKVPSDPTPDQTHTAPQAHYQHEPFQHALSSQRQSFQQGSQPAYQQNSQQHHSFQQGSQPPYQQIPEQRQSFQQGWQPSYQQIPEQHQSFQQGSQPSYQQIPEQRQSFQQGLQPSYQQLPEQRQSFQQGSQPSYQQVPEQHQSFQQGLQQSHSQQGTQHSREQGSSSTGGSFYPPDYRPEPGHQELGFHFPQQKFPAAPPPAPKSVSSASHVGPPTPPSTQPQRSGPVFIAGGNKTSEPPVKKTVAKKRKTPAPKAPSADIESTDAGQPAPEKRTRKKKTDDGPSNLALSEVSQEQAGRAKRQRIVTPKAQELADEKAEKQKKKAKKDK
ncbi:hypothetical protein C8J56DRAFT_1046424 [Mycena floridula]|nr:hypothetical protein C8J56DRAFT_1046424 [Mycena floridula]